MSPDRVDFPEVRLHCAIMRLDFGVAARLTSGEACRAQCVHECHSLVSEGAVSVVDSCDRGDELQEQHEEQTHLVVAVVRSGSTSALPPFTSNGFRLIMSQLQERL